MQYIKVSGKCFHNLKIDDKFVDNMKTTALMMNVEIPEVVEIKVAKDHMIVTLKEKHFEKTRLLAGFASSMLTLLRDEQLYFIAEVLGVDNDYVGYNEEDYIFKIKDGRCHELR